jgi:adenosylcobinamide kinase/adenosylcobinamide-phosphate guanylyltransferase
MPLPPLSLVLGGARSGKSAYAENLLEDERQPVYVATATASDAEMTARIEHHRQRRGARWLTIEEPLDLPGALRMHARPGRAVLVDCLTLWLSNLMLADADFESCTVALLETLPSLAAPVVFVANEVGCGIVPDNALARRFRDHAGWLNQRLATRCHRVVFLVAGLSMVLKDAGTGHSES